MRRGALVVLLLIGALNPGGAWAERAPGTGIGGTAHDFSADGGGVGLCTFCHTPHRAIQTQLLWNHTLSSSTFQWDATSTTAGTSYPTIKGDKYLGPTTKCLSCHDGTVAIGDVAWWQERKPASLSNLTLVWPSAVNVGASGGVAGSMAGNHPVAMPYPYQQARNTYNGIETGAEYTANEWQPDPRSLNIRLYNDTGNGFITAGPAALKTGIECPSCHDPHNRAAVDVFFLRGKLSGSDTAYICLKCHVK